MARKKVHWRQDPAIMARLTEVERRLLRGVPNTVIAADLHVDEKTIRNDRGRLRELWRERTEGEVADLKAERVRELDDIKRLALDAYTFDLDAERAVLYGRGEDGRAVSVERDAKGSAQFRGQKAQALNVARQAVMDAAKVLGLVVDKAALTDAEGKASVFTIKIDSGDSGDSDT